MFILYKQDIREYLGMRALFNNFITEALMVELKLYTSSVRLN